MIAVSKNERLTKDTLSLKEGDSRFKEYFDHDPTAFTQLRMTIGSRHDRTRGRGRRVQDFATFPSKNSSTYFLLFQKNYNIRVSYIIVHGTFMKIYIKFENKLASLRSASRTTPGQLILELSKLAVAPCVRLVNQWGI